MTSSFKRFKTEGIYGQFNTPFQHSLNDSEIRFLFTNVILDTYFPDTKDNYWNAITANPFLQYQKEIETAILQETKEQYWVKEKNKLKYIRDWRFRDLVKKAYKDTCCISKLQVAPSYGIIEACHILPHAEFGNDSIKNGIALCVNLHKAFDNGLISIGNNYEMIFNKKKHFNENTSPYNLSQFKNKSILLPDNKTFYPSLEFLKWHRKEHGF